MITAVAFVSWLCVITLLTFAVWLRPQVIFGTRLPEWYGFIAGATATLFFLTCFALGVWIAIARIRGAIWLPSA